MIRDFGEVIRDTQLIDLVTTGGSASVAVVSAKLRVIIQGIAYAIFYTPSNRIPCIVPWGTQFIEDAPDEYFQMILLNCNDADSFEELRIS